MGLVIGGVVEKAQTAPSPPVRGGAAGLVWCGSRAGWRNRMHPTAM